MDRRDNFRSYCRVGLVVYAVLSLLCAVYVVDLIQGGRFALAFKRGPLSVRSYTVMCVCLSWLLIGSMLVLAYRKVINRSNVLVFGLFYLYAFAVLNFLRERIKYGDISDYTVAALNLHQGQPLHDRYLYPPFWGTLLQPFAPLGSETIAMICIVANYLAVLLFFFLLYKTLKRYGFSRTLSAAAIFVILCVNVPVLRTLGYVQVNLHVVNLILLSLLFYRKNAFLSAMALCLAMHLKISPIILVLPFLWNRDWKWLTYFGISALAIVGLTSYMNDFGYYLNFLSNISRITSVSLRDYSIDSFVKMSVEHLGITMVHFRPIAALLKIALLIVSLFIFFKSVRQKSFYTGEKREETVFNGYILLLFLMMALSPLIWVHHTVFIIFPFVVILKRIATPKQALLYSIAFVSFFWIPTFDFYPFSYHRLIAVGLCYTLFFTFLKTPTPSEWFKQLNILGQPSRSSS